MSLRGYRLSPQAHDDFREIADQLGDHNLEGGIRVLEAIQDTFQLLQNFPEIGQARDDLHRGIRVIVPRKPAHRYAIFYYLAIDEIHVSDIIHTARDWVGMFYRRER